MQSRSTQASELESSNADAPPGEAGGFHGLGDYDPAPMYRIWGEIERLGLQANVAELEMFGYTVVPPEKVVPAIARDKLISRMLEIAVERYGFAPDMTGDAKSDADPGIASIANGMPLVGLLRYGPEFEAVLMNECSLALQSYLLGEHCILDTFTGFLKGPGGPPLNLHADELSPAPFRPIAETANSTFTLTDYTREDGALAVVPGSHRYCRQPRNELGEGWKHRIPVETPAGSLIVWHGNLWHGAYGRTRPGTRATLINTFKRAYRRGTDLFEFEGIKDAYARNPPRFRRLLGDWRDVGDLMMDDASSFAPSLKYDLLAKGPY